MLDGHRCKSQGPTQAGQARSPGLRKGERALPSGRERDGLRVQTKRLFDWPHRLETPKAIQRIC